MRKMITTVLLCAALAAWGQEKPPLGILPFTGGSGQEGNTIAMLFTNSRDLQQVFRVVPRTSSVEAIMQEQQFQRTSGLTDTDTIARLGKQYNADYVVSGHVARLGNANLLLISIVNVETMEQIAGDYREYGTIEEVRALLPDMAAHIIDSVQGRGGPEARPRLAVPPLAILDERVERDDAEILARILATEIANTHQYIVLPRLTTIQNAIETEKKIQKSGLTDRDTLAAIGKATNAQYVLSGTITSLGRLNLFDVKIQDVETATLRPGAGSDREYQSLEDGIEIMSELAYDITGVQTERYLENMRRKDEQKRREAEAAAEREWQDSWENSRLYAGLRLGWSPRFYELSKDVGSGSAENSGSFDAALQVSAYIYSLFGVEIGLQTGLWFGADTVSHSGTDGEGDFTASFTSSSLMIPLLAKLSYRMSGRFVASLFTGPYFSIPLGKIEYKTDGGTDSYDANIPAGWLIGVAPGVRLGPGTLFADIRYGGDAGKTSISDSNGVLSVYSRGILSFTVGYELGFLR
jgi:TolB-like protein